MGMDTFSWDERPFPRHETGLRCEGCGEPLWTVWPSNLVVCDNPVCEADQEPRFLIEAVPVDGSGPATRPLGWCGGPGRAAGV